jgi:formate hydrogenlyase subunit 3/multisubunit Na+/H+ antiporter MnhD subunit
LGARIFTLIQLIGKEYFYLLLIASIISIPISYYFVAEWLQQFAYKTAISWLNYVITIILLATIILITVSYQTLRTSMINPADTLREE